MKFQIFKFCHHLELIQMHFLKTKINIDVDTTMLEQFELPNIWILHRKLNKCSQQKKCYLLIRGKKIFPNSNLVYILGKYSDIQYNISKNLIWPIFFKEQPMHLLQLYGHQCTCSNYMDNYMELNFTNQTL